MQPVEFIAKWKAVELTERAAAHSHFHDLCALLDEPTPTDADHVGTHYCFERGVTKTTGGKGWADVWKRECFAWEYKGKHKDLTAAFVQLQRYALALENPPLMLAQKCRVGSSPSAIYCRAGTRPSHEKSTIELNGRITFHFDLLDVESVSRMHLLRQWTKVWAIHLRSSGRLKPNASRVV
jgi:hypothetical protein